MVQRSCPGCTARAQTYCGTLSVLFIFAFGGSFRSPVGCPLIWIYLLFSSMDRGWGGLEEPTELKSHLITSCQRYLLSTRCVPERG